MRWRAAAQRHSLNRHSLTRQRWNFGHSSNPVCGRTSCNAAADLPHIPFLLFILVLLLAALAAARLSPLSSTLHARGQQVQGMWLPVCTHDFVS